MDKMHYILPGSRHPINANAILHNNEFTRDRGKLEEEVCEAVKGLNEKLDKLIGHDLAALRKRAVHHAEGGHLSEREAQSTESSAGTDVLNCTRPNLEEVRDFNSVIANITPRSNYLARSSRQTNKGTMNSFPVKQQALPTSRTPLPNDSYVSTSMRPPSTVPKEASKIPKSSDDPEMVYVPELGMMRRTAPSLNAKNNKNGVRIGSQKRSAKAYDRTAPKRVRLLQPKTAEHEKAESLGYDTAKLRAIG